jgi:hypothetical protein
MLGLSTGFLTWLIAREFGKPAGLMLLAVLMGIGAEHVRTTMSEALGLTLGTLATAVLWCGAGNRDRRTVAVGLTVLTIALNARAGAFLTLPALVVWSGLVLKDSEQAFGWRSAAWAIGAITVGFLMNSLWLWLYGGDFALGHGNFSLVLYGFSTGEPGYTRIFADHPETNGLGEAQLNRFAYAHAFENIRSHPLDLVRGLWIGATRWQLGLRGYVRAILSVVPYESVWNSLFQFVLAVSAIRWIWVARRDPRTSLILVSALGMLASGVIVFPDAGYRVLVVSYPMFFLMGVVAAASWGPIAPRPTLDPRPAIAFSVALVLAASIGPAIAHGFRGTQLIEPLEASPGDVVLVSFVGAATRH